MTSTRKDPKSPGLHYNADEVKRQLQQIPKKLDQIITTQNLSYNRLAGIAGFRPDILYRIRDGEALPSCETLVNIKNVLPDLSLDWWLCDQGEPASRDKLLLEQENKHLKSKLSQMQEKLKAVQQQLSDIIDKN